MHPSPLRVNLVTSFSSHFAQIQSQTCSVMAHTKLCIIIPNQLHGVIIAHFNWLRFSQEGFFRACSVWHSWRHGAKWNYDPPPGGITAPWCNENQGKCAPNTPLCQAVCQISFSSLCDRLSRHPHCTRLSDWFQHTCNSSATDLSLPHLIDTIPCPFSSPKGKLSVLLTATKYGNGHLESLIR